MIACFNKIHGAQHLEEAFAELATLKSSIQERLKGAASEMVAVASLVTAHEVSQERKELTELNWKRVLHTLSPFASFI